MHATPIARASRPGFSLVELLLVILIVSILMGLTIVGAQFALRKGYTSKSQVQLKVLESGLEKFQADRLEYPNPSTGGSKVLYIALSGDGITQADLTKAVYAGAPDGKLDDNERKWGTYVEELLSPGGNKSLQKWIEAGSYKILDGFGEEIQYRCAVPATNSQQNPAYDLWSYGSDTTKNAADPKAVDKWLKNW